MNSSQNLFNIDDIQSFELGEPRTEEDGSDLVLDVERRIGRRLTRTEASAVESMGSEHASYASSRPFLKKLPVNGANHIAAIGDEAAAVIMGFDKNGDPIVAAYSSESHNHPSFVCAHPGAASGTGGNQRDNAALTGTLPSFVLEARRQSDPITNPTGDPVAQHVRETTKGIGDYANAMGIPHGHGSIKFSPNFAGNNLVNVMAVSFANGRDLLVNKVPLNDEDLNDFDAIYVGKQSDDTGIGGTKFASKALDMGDTTLNSKAVQDPDPHLQYEVIRGIERVAQVAREEGWSDLFSIKDMGAAGLLCSTVEQLHENVGVVINGDLVPRDIQRDPIELLEAETQERFFIYAHESVSPKIIEIFNEEIGLPNVNVGAQARIIGRCNDQGRYVFLREGRVEVDLEPHFMTEVPDIERKYKPRVIDSKLPEMNLSLEEEIGAVLRSINFKSDEPEIHRHYDTYVQGHNVVNRGEAAAMLRLIPELGGEIGISASFDSNVRYGLINPKFQAIDSVLRGAYRMALVGASIVGVTNNANYGRTTVPEEFNDFVEGQSGLEEVCLNWTLEGEYLEMLSSDEKTAKTLESDGRSHITINSGNCSLNKANKSTGTAIPPTTIAGLVGWTNKPENYATWSAQGDESFLYLVGERSSELGGTDFIRSSYGEEELGGQLHEIDYDVARKEVVAIIKVVREGLVSSGNLIEEGGLCKTMAEISANSEPGIRIDLDLDAGMGSENLGYREKLFSEQYGVVLEVPSQNRERFLEVMSLNGVNTHEIGKISNEDSMEGSLRFNSVSREIYLPQEEVREVYRNKLTCALEGDLIDVEVRVR